MIVVRFEYENQFQHISTCEVNAVGGFYHFMIYFYFFNYCYFDWKSPTIEMGKTF